MSAEHLNKTSSNCKQQIFPPVKIHTASYRAKMACFHVVPLARVRRRHGGRANAFQIREQKRLKPIVGTNPIVHVVALRYVTQRYRNHNCYILITSRYNERIECVSPTLNLIKKKAHIRRFISFEKLNTNDITQSAKRTLDLLKWTEIYLEKAGSITSDFN